AAGKEAVAGPEQHVAVFAVHEESPSIAPSPARTPRWGGARVFAGGGVMSHNKDQIAVTTPPSPYDGDTSPSRTPRRGGSRGVRSARRNQRRPRRAAAKPALTP